MFADAEDFNAPNVTQSSSADFFEDASDNDDGASGCNPASRMPS